MRLEMMEMAGEVGIALEGRLLILCMYRRKDTEGVEDGPA